MILVNCALRQDDIVAIVEAVEFEGKKPFKLNKKQGIQLYFDADVADSQAAAKEIKAAIKATEVGRALLMLQLNNYIINKRRLSNY